MVILQLCYRRRIQERKDYEAIILREDNLYFWNRGFNKWSRKSIERYNVDEKF